MLLLFAVGVAKLINIIIRCIGQTIIVLLSVFGLTLSQIVADGCSIDSTIYGYT